MIINILAKIVFLYSHELNSPEFSQVQFSSCTVTHSAPADNQLLPLQ